MLAVDFPGDLLALTVTFISERKQDHLAQMWKYFFNDKVG